jgi:tetratricopeptide (TPR) repeat protein
MIRLPWQRTLGLVALVLVLPLRADERLTEYPFAVEPLEILSQLKTLKQGNPKPFVPIEEALLKKSWLFKQNKSKQGLTDPEMIELMIMASGVEDPKEVKAFQAKYRKLANEVKAATKSLKSDREKGDKLFTMLHKGVMKEGYELKQSSFTEVFNTGKYNCVSSMAFFVFLAREIGLKVEPISIPGSSFQSGHATCDLIIDKKRIQIEATNPDGFDWEAKLKRPGVIPSSFAPDRKSGHVVDFPSVVAMIYSNRGVDLSKAEKPDRLGAIRSYIAAACLAPTDETTTNNLHSEIVNWGPKLSDTSDFEGAIRVMLLGQKISPKSSKISNNLHVVFQDAILAALAKKEDLQALKRIELARKSLPDDRDFKSAAEWFDRNARKILEKEGYEAGLNALDRAVKILPPEEKKALASHRTGILRRWSQSCLKQGDVDGSVKALARGFAVDATDREIHDALGYHTQEALPVIAKKSGTQAALEHFLDLKKRFPNIKDIIECGETFAHRAMEPFREKKEFVKGLKAIDEYAPFLTDPKQKGELAASLYDCWADTLSEKGKWKEAMGRYVEGVKKFPDCGRLSNNAIALIDRWAGMAMKKGEWTEAIQIYDEGLQAFPGNNHLKHNKEYCESKKVASK